MSVVIAGIVDAAQKWVQGRLRSEVFPLPSGMSEDEFTKAMDALVRWTIEAWADGYYNGYHNAQQRKTKTNRPRSR